MGRIFLTFLLTLIPLHVYAEEIQPCSTWSSGENAETTCNAQAGCYWESSESECKACSAGSLNTPAHYGPGCNINNVCDSDFPYGYQHTINGSTGARGARTKYECYKKLDGETSNGHGAKCNGTNGEPVNGTCREYYRDGTGNNTTINLNGTNYTYKGNAAHHWVSCPDADNQYDIGEGSSNTLDSAGYHMEASTVDETYTANTKCYANKMSCNQFKWYHTNNTNDATSFSDWTSDRYLIWNANNGRWENESNSICSRTQHYDASQEFSLDNNYYVCNISEETVSQTQITTQSLSTYQNQGNQNSVEYTFIKYSNSNNTKNWICESCKAGYMGFLNVSQNEQRCISVAQGYYSDGCHRFPTGQQKECVLEDWNYGAFSSRNECNWYSTAGRQDLWDKIKTFCHPCYAGMTTFKFNNPDDPNSGLNLAQTTDGAFSPRQCHYSNDTNFCDAYGCVSMDQLLGATQTLSQDDWTWYMQQ